MGASSESSVAAMEKVEEGKSLMKNGDGDGISALPDCLLIEILSRLPSTKDAIRTGILSKRWKHIWTLVTTLIFKHSAYLPNEFRQDLKLMSDFVSFVDKTLTQCRQLKLKKFVVDICYDSSFESQVKNWIRFAVMCNVQELDLMLCSEDLKAEFLLDQKLFTSSYFTDLRLAGCVFNPTGAINWKNLKSLWIAKGKLDEDLIKNILSGSPLLETLMLVDCYGYRWLDITSKSVKKLVLCGYEDPEDELDDLDDIIEINAPNISSLTIQGHLMLWKVLLQDVSSVVEANLDYFKLGHWETTREETEEEMLKGFILNLRHVKELYVGHPCTEAVSRLEAKGFVFPSNTKFPSNWYDSDSDSVEGGDGEVL